MAAKRALATPGERLLEAFPRPMGVSQYRLANEIGVPSTQISEIVAGGRVGGQHHPVRRRTMELTADHVDRKDLLEAISELTGRAEALVEGHTPEQLLWKPTPRAWSIAQCLDHMTVSLRLYLPPFDKALAAGGPRGEGPFRPGVVARLWIRLIQPEGPRLPTPPSMRPRSHGAGSVQPTSLDPERLLAEFREARDRLAELIRSSEGLDLARIRMRSPVIPILRFHVAAWFLTCVQHDRRHMAQAERVAARLAGGSGPAV